MLNGKQFMLNGKQFMLNVERSPLNVYRFLGILRELGKSLFPLISMNNLSQNPLSSARISP